MASRKRNEYIGNATSRNQPYYDHHPSKPTYDSRFGGSRATTSRLSRATTSAGEGLSFADSLTSASAGIDLNHDNFQEQSDVNFSESDFALPSSPPPFTTKPLFRGRHSHTGSLGSVQPVANNKHWEEDEPTDMSATPVQKPSRATNLTRDRNILKRLSANFDTGRRVVNPSSPAGMSGMVIPSEFDTDGMDANTPKLERALVRAAEKEIDPLSSRYMRLRAPSNPTTAPPILATSDDSTESRKSRVALMTTLARRKEPTSKPHTFGGAVDMSPELPGIRRSISSGSSDGRRQRRDILALGPASPSRRRRLQRGETKKDDFLDSETPRAKNRSPQRPPLTRPVSTSAAEAQLEDSRYNSTIDWLAAASPEGREDPRSTERKQPNVATTSSSRLPAQKSAPLPSTSPNTVTKPRQTSNFTSYEPISSQKPKQTQPTSPIPQADSPPPPISTYKFEDTHDLLRRFSKATSASPSPTSSLSLVDPKEDPDSLSLGQAPRPIKKVKINPTPYTVPLPPPLDSNNPAQSASVKSKRFPLSTSTSSIPYSPTKADMQVPPSARSSNRSPMSSNRLSREANSAAVASHSSQTPTSHLRSHSTPKSSRSQGRNRSMVLRSPTLSDYDDLAGFSASPISVKREERTKSPSPIPYPERSNSSSRPKIPIIPKADEEYHTDDSLDRLLANDTDYASLLRPTRFEDESFLEATTATAPPPSYRPQRLQRELAEHARLVNKLQVLQLEIRDARKGIEVIEKRITHEDGSSSEYFDDSMIIHDDNDTERGIKNKASRIQAERLKKHPRKPMGLLGKFLCFLGFISFLILIELKLWSDTIIPEYSNVSSDEWWARHPPGEYQFGASFRFYWSFMLPVLRVVWWALCRCWTVVVWAFAGVQWLEERVMDGVMPPPAEFAEAFSSISSISSETPLSSSLSASWTSSTAAATTKSVISEFATSSASYYAPEETEVPCEGFDSDVDTAATNDIDTPGFYDAKGNWIADITWETHYDS